MLLWRRNMVEAPQHHRQKPTDPANDRQRMLARELVDAVWVTQVTNAAKRIIAQRSGDREPMVIMVPPDFRVYDAAERVVVEHECRYTLVTDDLNAGWKDSQQ